MKISFNISFALLLVLFEKCLCSSYYDILGVEKDASTAEIKKAFRNLALKFHPDKVKNADKNTEERFREIVSAYEVLSDPEKRRAYDQSGDSFHQNFNNNNSQDGFNFNDFFKNFDEAMKNHNQQHHKAHWKAHREAMKKNGFSFDFDDIFEGFNFHDTLLNIHGGFDEVDQTGEASYFEEISVKNGKNCKTVTKRQGNTVFSHTECH